MDDSPGEWKEWSRLVLSELKRFDKSHDRLAAKLDTIDERFDHYNEALIRNTVTLEEHVKRTNLLENKVSDVEVEVTGLKSHVDKVKKYFKVLDFLSSDTGKLMIKILCLLAIALASYKPGMSLIKLIKDWLLF